MQGRAARPCCDTKQSENQTEATLLCEKSSAAREIAQIAGEQTERTSREAPVHVVDSMHRSLASTSARPARGHGPTLGTARAREGARMSHRAHRILFELGHGGMSRVYLAIATDANGHEELRVVKQLRSDLASEWSFIQMFFEEARLSARLVHPNIVRVTGGGFDGQHHFLELEYLEGQSLDVVQRHASKRGGLPQPVALFILTRLLAGLHYAHELRGRSGEPLHIVHRDVSPPNVLVTYTGEVKLLDFGIAKAAGSPIVTRTGVVKGRITYMAPEQALRRPVDRRADVFSVGVMLWQVLSGARLWGDLSDEEIFKRLEHGDIPAPSSVRTGVSPELEATCRRALSRDPAERHATAAELRDELERYMARTGQLIEPREVANAMTVLFGVHRAAVRRELEARLAWTEPTWSEAPTVR
jgi:serine/threonine-protein kinase